MTINFTSTTFRGTDRRQRRLGLGVAILGAALTVAAVAGIATWRSAGQAEQAGPASIPQPAAPVASTVSASNTSRSGTEQGGVLFVVASQEAAQHLRQSIAEADTIRAVIGLAPLARAEVLVVASSAEQDEALLRAHAEADAIRAGLGLSSIPLIDLRAPAAVTGTAAVAAGDALARELDALTAAGPGVPTE